VRRPSLLPLLAVGLALVIARVPDAGAWGAQGHQYIAQNYSQHLPPGLDGLRNWDSVVYAHVNDPDIRRPSTPGEGPRHFMDIDAYPEFFSGTLSHDRATLEAQYGATTVSNRGVLPWAVGEVTDYISRLFQQADWDSSALMIADLCHYVGDGHQPLHCTQNYDGQFTGNNGIHSRYETTMLNMFLGDIHTTPHPVSFYASPVDAMFDVIGASWQDVDDVLNGDNVAKAASGGSTSSPLYYQTLWQETQPFTEERIQEASRATASFVYTAWVDAGQPPVPGSTAVPPIAVGAPRLELSPNPFRAALSMRYEAAGPATIEVFDARGARVARLDGAPGAGSLSWRPGAGASRASAGIYFVSLSALGGRVMRRACFLR